MTSQVLGVKLDDLPEVQAAGVREIIGFLTEEEQRRSYTLRTVPGWHAPWPSGTVRFRDATDRVWYVRPDGSFTWRT